MAISQEWALLDADDNPICDYIGITEASIGEQATTLTEPIEGGLLAAYNKVQLPDTVTVSIAISWEKAVQSAALARLTELKQAVGAGALCKLVTPYRVFDSLSLETISQVRSATRNATTLICELSFVRVRSVKTGSQSVAWSPRNPSSADPVDAGRVQAREQTTAAKIFFGG